LASREGAAEFPPHPVEISLILGVGKGIFCSRAVNKIAKKFCVNQSALGFCSKKVLTSSNKHHHNGKMETKFFEQKIR
jgi:hypothetical protein